MAGLKFDETKLRYDLIPFEGLEQIVAAITYGAEKYSDTNYQTVASHQYMAAAYRHLTAVSMGEDMDEDTGLPHLAHAGACILFMLWHIRHKLSKKFDFSKIAEQFAERKRVPKTCDMCKGTGIVAAGDTCLRCKGGGFEKFAEELAKHGLTKCKNCGGKGTIMGAHGRSMCHPCNGTGRV